MTENDFRNVYHRTSVDRNRKGSCNELISSVAGAGAVLYFGDKLEVSRPRVMLQQIHKRLADACLFACATVADEPVNFAVVLLDELDGHGRPRGA